MSALLLRLQISFYDLGQTHTRELSSRVVIGGSGVVPLCMCVYATPGDEASERVIYGDSQARPCHSALLLEPRHPCRCARSWLRSGTARAAGQPPWLCL